MKNLTWQNPEQLFVAQELINKVKSKCCGIKGEGRRIVRYEGWTKQKTKYIAWGCDNRAANCQYFEREFFNGKEEIQKANRYISANASKYRK